MCYIEFDKLLLAGFEVKFFSLLNRLPIVELNQTLELFGIIIKSTLMIIGFNADKIFHEFIDEFAVVCKQFHIESGMTLKSIFLEHALTEAVNGGNNRLVKIHQGEF